MNRLKTFQRFLVESKEEWIPCEIWLKLRDQYIDMLEYFDMYENQHYIDFNFIKVKPEFRKRGLLDIILKEVIKYSEKLNKPIILSPESGHGTPLNILEKMYEKHDFEYIDDSNRPNFKLPYPEEICMIRYPR